MRRKVQPSRPDVPIAAEDYFTKLAEGFDDPDSLRKHLEEQVPQMFHSLSASPDWIQEADWPWAGGKPMMFVGSIDAPDGTFQDDGRFFLFWSPDAGTTECIIQVA